MTPEDVVLVSYDPAWPGLFEREAQRLRELLPSAEVEHVGSTSVPGLCAKPFIDILVGLENESELADSIPALCTLDHEYLPEAEQVVAERRFFRRLDPQPGFHVHVVARSAPLFSNLPAFRDELRGDPERARAYATLKQELASRHASDVNAYTLAKGPYIEDRLAALDGAKSRGS